MKEQFVLNFPTLLLMLSGFGLVFRGISYLRGKKSFRNYPLTRDVKILNVRMGVGSLVVGVEVILWSGVSVFRGPIVYFLTLAFLIVFSSGILFFVVLIPKARSLKERYGGK